MSYNKKFSYNIKLINYSNPYENGLPRISGGNAPHNSVIHFKGSPFDTETGNAFLHYAEENRYNIAKYLDVNGNCYYEMVKNPITYIKDGEMRNPLTFNNDRKRNPIKYRYNSNNFVYNY